MTELMRWRMLAYLSALFIAGAITGAAVMAHSTAGSQTLKIGRSEEIAALLKQRLVPLNLTPEQREKFAPLIKRASEELEASHLQCLQQCSAAVENLHAQIRLALTPEQLEKEKELQAERLTMIRKKYNYPPESAPPGKP